MMYDLLSLVGSILFIFLLLTVVFFLFFWLVFLVFSKFTVWPKNFSQVLLSNEKIPVTFVISNFAFTLYGFIIGHLLSGFYNNFLIESFVTEIIKSSIFGASPY